MSEPSDNLSNETPPSVPTVAAPARSMIRSRIRAAPNVAISSGLARTRRLSGHFTTNPEKTIQPTTAEATTDKKLFNPQRSRSPSIHASPNPHDFNENSRETILNTQLNSIQQAPSPILKPKSPTAHQHQQQHELGNSPRVPFFSKINSPKLTTTTTTSTDQLNVLNVVQANQSAANLSFRQFVNYQSNVLQQQSSISLVPLSPSVSYNQPPTPNLMPCTPGGTEYNPKFSNEHIMNIIKHKSMQKLKKIEAESLKEKRKSYQTASTESNVSCLDGSTADGTMPIDRSKTRMRDLLYYNNKNKKVDSNETVLEALVTSPDQSSTSDTSAASSNSLDNSINEEAAAKKQQELLNSAPQLKFADDGSIIINEESLIIERQEQVPVYNSTVVESEKIDNLTYISYRKFHHTKKWTERETAKFYKALSMIGTDFTMIQRLFSHRSRDEIKRKFKREEKLNQAYVDKIMSKTSEIDLSVFVSASSDDERKKSTELKKPKVAKKRTPKEKSPPEAKAKLKRVQKRAFIESESEEETDETNKRQKALQFPSSSPAGGITEQTKFAPDEITLDVSKSSLVNENESSGEEEEFILDLDNNTISTQKTVFANGAAIGTNVHQQKADENVILDDSKIVESVSENKESSPSKSKIIITYHDY